MQQIERSRLNLRALVLFLLTISFLIMIFSGVLLDNIEFENSVTADIVSRVFHKVGVSIFFVIAIFHIYYNWKPFIRYFKKGNNFTYWRELLISIVSVAIVLFLSTLYTYNQ